MKQKIFIPLFILLIGLSAFAQTNEKLNCPVISVIPPAATVDSGEVMKFSTSLDKKIIKEQNLKLFWTVDRGKITEGQGTKEILVSTEGLEDTTINAIVEIEGLPENCVNKFSDAGIVVAFLHCDYIDEFGELANDDIRARIDNLFIRLQSDPYTTGYIENWGSKREITKRENIIRDHIRLRNYDQTRIVFVDSGRDREIRTKLWRFLSGVDVSPCIKSLAKTKDEK